MSKNNFLPTGFTLLEVIIAMAIVALVLGSVFTLLAGSKRLAFKAAEDVGQTLFLRAAINAAQLLEEPEYPELPQRYREAFELNIEDTLEKPEQQTRPLRLALEPYTVEQDNITITTLRWKQLDTSQ